MVLHNYVHVLASCDRVNLIQDGVIAFDKPTAETSVEELTEIVVSEYRARADGGVMTLRRRHRLRDAVGAGASWCDAPTARSSARRCTSTRTG